ncbi:hypothetical protein [Maricaulis sp.]|uniref:hypothetical protein n=1 Tax=Maricaulis sp. TaxID=1486257 RepID=UPI0026155A0C|nr:hypothetical protein [Maricaulis sp.]
MVVLSALLLWVVGVQDAEPAAPPPAEPFAPFASPAEESWFSLSPDGNTAVYGSHNADWGEHRVMMRRRLDRGWSDPQPVAIDGAPWPVEMRAMRFSPNGDQVVFSSAPLPGEARDDWDLWIAYWADGRLVAPWRLPEPVNSSAHDFHASLAANGTVYFASRRRGGEGGSDLYRAIPDMSVGWRVERLRTLSTAQSEADIWIAPDESLAILARTDGADGFGGDDLYLAERRGEVWSEPVNLGAVINTPGYEYGAHGDLERGVLWFTSFREGSYSIYTTLMPGDESASEVSD